MTVVTTTWDQINSINWTAVFAAVKYYNDNLWDYDATHYRRYEWMLENWGIEHGNEHLKIVDEAKYMMMILRFG